VFASDTLRISGFLLMTSYLHKQAFANASRRHRHAEAVRLIFAALGAWHVGIPVAGSGRSGLLLEARAY